MSSFRKRNVQKPIPGTRTSPQTGQVITSSGNPSLDVILGGGLPIGSICLIEEDKFVTYSKVLAKYFLAEGVLSKQSLFLGSLDDDPAELLRKLPKPLDEEEVEKEKQEEEKSGEVPKNGLRIAWRYNDLPMVNSEQTTAKIGHHFNLLEPMDPLLVDYADIAVWNDRPPHVHDQDAYNDTDNEEGANEPGGGDDTVTIEDRMAELQGHGKQEHSREQSSQESRGDYDDNGDGDNVFIGQDVDMEQPNSTNINKNQREQVTDNTNEPGQEQQSTAEAMDTNENTKSSEDNSKGTTLTSSSSTTTPPAAQMAKEEQKSKIFDNEKFLRILGEIHPLLREAKFTTGMMGGQKGLCRVCITSLGSPAWYDEQFAKDILKFLTVLRATVRSSVAVCMITMPMHLVAKLNVSLVSEIRQLVDYSIELESFAGSERETNPAFKEYNGLLHLRKVAAINTLSAYLPETFDLAFKLRRKKFVIEKLHLPPELQENQQNNNNPSAEIMPTLGCTGAASLASNSKPSLDF